MARTDSATLFRMAGSVVVATVIVTLLLSTGLWLFGAYDPEEEGHTTTQVQMLSRIDLAELLGEDGTVRQRQELPPIEPIDPLTIPRRAQAGYEQVEYDVDDKRRLLDAEYVGAAPAGIYEDQALEIVRSRRYEPNPAGMMDRRTELVDFQVEAGD